MQNKQTNNKTPKKPNATIWKQLPLHLKPVRISPVAQYIYWICPEAINFWRTSLTEREPNRKLGKKVILQTLLLLKTFELSLNFMLQEKNNLILNINYFELIYLQL